MEPRPFRRGDNVAGDADITEMFLQWSHALSGVETDLPGTRRDTIDKPSMEPRPFRRGDLAAGTVLVTVIYAFNGATPFQAWRLDVTMILVGRDVLQWSHALSGVETAATGVSGSQTEYLQWSHALSGVETGARHRHQKNLRDLQWSHALSGVETPYTDFPPPHVSVLQWSHALSGVETS